MANESDIKSLMTLSSISDVSTTAHNRSRWRNAPLHERCTMVDMVKIKEAFQSADRNKLLPNEFRTVLRNLLNVEYDDDEFKILFMKINTNRNGEIDWDELVSHLLLGYFGNDPENQRASLQPPIMGLPVVMRSQHRHPISRICFCPDVAKMKKVADLETKLLATEELITNLKSQLHGIEQRLRLNNVKIKGVTVKKEENIFQISDNKSIEIKFNNSNIKEDFITTACSHEVFKAYDLGFRDSQQ
ncbi:unnamed protein product [Diatraea saccharalis]|uniref:EF-hand domain-containing protein n=1 Tax=Diatraea saccharalis TaxID=40085 RepID=A0A9N9QXC0_9NEOP|nr:unnamed protein product [Diatraea saccharalis]